jgi:hypothetical protein
MDRDFIILTKDEIESFTDYIKELIFTKTKYYCTDGQNEMDEKELSDYKHEIEKWWDIYDSMNGRTFYKLDDYDSIRHLEIDISFDIFGVLYENVWEIDNPLWLYNILSVWKKCHDYIERNDKKSVCSKS